METVIDVIQQAGINNDIKFFQNEYMEARKIMGTKGANLDNLFNGVTHLYVYAPEEMTLAFISLLKEIELRQMMITRYSPLSSSLIINKGEVCSL